MKRTVVFLSLGLFGITACNNDIESIGCGGQCYYGPPEESNCCGTTPTPVVVYEIPPIDSPDQPRISLTNLPDLESSINNICTNNFNALVQQAEEKAPPQNSLRLDVMSRSVSCCTSGTIGCATVGCNSVTDATVTQAFVDAANRRGDTETALGTAQVDNCALQTTDVPEPYTITYICQGSTVTDFQISNVNALSIDLTTSCNNLPVGGTSRAWSITADAPFSTVGDTCATTPPTVTTIISKFQAPITTLCTNTITDGSGTAIITSWGAARVPL